MQFALAVPDGCCVARAGVVLEAKAWHRFGAAVLVPVWIRALQLHGNLEMRAESDMRTPKPSDTHIRGP